VTAPTPIALARGELWWVELDPVIGSEQAGRRPAVIVSADAFLQTGANRAAIAPVSTKYRALPSWVAVGSPDLREPSWALPDQIRTVDFARLKRRIGRVDAATMTEIDRVLRLVLGL
jgi:mRNA interferase MazF